MKTAKVRVLIVDDSAVVRQTLTRDPVVRPGDRSDRHRRRSLCRRRPDREQVPDVITLDIEMPRMDGLTFLQKIMSQHPIPVVICSSLAEEGAQSTLRALEYGAVDIITKPQLGTKQFLEESRVIALRGGEGRGRGAARVRSVPASTVEPKLTADADSGPRHPRHGRNHGESRGHRRLHRRNRSAARRCSKRCPPMRPAS